jgi:CubicO group peptidase (beta-lactamase class C family)
VPARRAITLRDLLTFRMGLGMIAHAEPWPIQLAERALGTVGFGPPNVACPHDPDDWMRRIGTLPLQHQPGEVWQYGLGSYVLGVLISRVADQPFETFLRERLLGPLGMRDTGFTVPAAKRGRLATAYRFDAAAGRLAVVDDAAESAWAQPPAFPDGGAGLVSTADDFLSFARMLLEKGRHGRERVLSRASVETMTTDQLLPAQKCGDAALFLGARGWGFGVAIDSARSDLNAVPGRYGWDGGFGTTWANDPREELVALQLTQVAGVPGISPLGADFWTAAYSALED